MEKTKLKFFLKFLTSSCLILLATASCFAQAIKLNGIVKNENGIILKSVSVVAKIEAIIKAYDISNNKGEFELSLNANQNYIVELTSVGYNKLTIYYKYEENKNYKTYILQEKKTGEDTVVITAKRGVYERNDTVFYNADYFKKNNENSVGDLLKNMPGVQVLPNGKVVVNGEIATKVLIEGKDLTGESYEKIINNLSPHNIEQIQVLKKYKDPYVLTNKVDGSSELAINITFKKKRIIPSFRLFASLGIPIKYYEQKSDFLVLTKKYTGVNFINVNTIGNTLQLIASPNSIFGTINPTLFPKLGKGLSYKNNVNEIFLNLAKNNYSFNNTKYFDNSSQFNLGKKITNKLGINYTPEKIEQFENSNSVTSVGNQVFAETYSFIKPSLRKNSFTVKNELIYMIKKNEQIKINFNLIAEKEDATDNRLTNNVDINISNTNKKKFANSLFNYTKFLKKNIVLNIATFYDAQINNEALINDGTIYNNTLINSSLGKTNLLAQNIISKESNFGTFIKIIRRKNDYSFTFQPTVKKIQGKFQSNLSATSVNNILYNNIDSFSNNFTYNQTSLSIPLTYNYDNANNKLTISIEPLHLNSTRGNIKNEIINFNTNLTYRYEFKSKAMLSLSFNKANNFTDFNKSFENNVIVSNANKISNTNFLLQSQSYNLSMSRSKFGSYNNKPNFYYYLNLGLNNPNYIANSNNNNFFTVQNFLNRDIQNKSINFTIRNNFSPYKWNVRFENNINASSRENNSLQNEIMITNISNAYNLDNRIVSKFKGLFNFEINNVFNFNTNKRKGTKDVRNALTDELSLEINLNYMKKTHIDIEAKNYYFKTIGSSTQNLLLLNISYKKLLNKNKIRFSFDIRNVTNRKAFVSQYLSVTNFSETRVELLPLFAIAKFEFLF
jgi:hypothetical protein